MMKQILVSLKFPFSHKLHCLVRDTCQMKAHNKHDGLCGNNEELSDRRFTVNNVIYSVHLLGAEINCLLLLLAQNPTKFNIQSCVSVP